MRTPSSQYPMTPYTPNDPIYPNDTITLYTPYTCSSLLMRAPSSPILHEPIHPNDPISPIQPDDPI